MFAQVESVEVVPSGREELSEMRLEEVVDKPVQVEHRSPGGRPGAPPHQRRDDLALVVGVQRECASFIRRAQDVGLHESDGTRRDRPEERHAPDPA